MNDAPGRTGRSNGYFSIDAQPGSLNIRYEAEVTLDVFRADPESVSETPLTDIPLDIMPFLLPFASCLRTGSPPSRIRSSGTCRRYTFV